MSAEEKRRAAASRARQWWLSLCVGVAAGGVASWPLASVAQEPVAADALQREGSWTLERLIARAVDGSPTVEAVRAQKRAAAAQVASARWQFFPVPSAEAERVEGQMLTVFRLEQPLWSGGRLRADLHYANAQHELAERSVAQTRRDVAFEVVSAYGNVLVAQGRVQVLSAGVTRLDDLYAMMRRRRDSGLSGEVDLQLAGARLEQARADLTYARSTEVTWLERLSQWVGEPLAAQDIAGVDTVSVRGVAPSQADAVWLERALDSDPALKRAQGQVEVAQARLRQARAALWPTVYARAEYQDGEIGSVRAEGTRVYVGASYAFGAGLSVASQIHAARAEEDAAWELQEAVRREVTSRVVGDLEEYRAVEAQVRQHEQNLRSMVEVLESYTRQFLAGNRTWLDLLNVTREQIEAQRQWVEARVRQAVMAYRLRIDAGDLVWMQG